MYANTEAKVELMDSVNELFRSASEILPQLAIDLKTVAQRLQLGQDDKAFSLLIPATNKLEAYLQLLNHIAQFLPEEQDWAEQQITALTYWLHMFTLAWQRSDFVLMADYLLYEIEPRVNQGHDWVNTQV